LGLREALTEANIPTLLMVLAHASGDDRWLQDPYRPTPARGPGDHDTGGLSDELQDEVRAAVLELVAQLESGEQTLAPPPTPERVAEMLSIALGEPIAPEAGEMMSEELGVLSRDVDFHGVQPRSDLDVLIIGAGFSGLCAAIKLQQAGIPFAILEKNADLGGTWLENTYPGCGVDTPVHIYSFSFAQRADWPRFFARQAEVAEYLEAVADDHGLRETVRFGTEVLSAAWDEEAARWRVHVREEDGTERQLTSAVLISAVGQLNRPSLPDIPGLETFEGPAMHTARWRPDVDLVGKRVGVLGTGASAMQLVPAIAGIPEQLVVFQRSPQWAIPNPNSNKVVGPERIALMERVPHYLSWYRLRQLWNFGDRLHSSLQIDPEWTHPERSINKVNERHRVFLTEYIERQLADRPDLLEKCVPTYPPYGKRPLLDHGWFTTIKRDDVELVIEDVVEVRPHGVVLADGREVELDALVLATGFQTLNMLGPIDVHGREGRSLREYWGEDDARAYLGMTVPGFPNFFCLFGPNTNAGHGGSHVFSVELQVRYVLQVLRLLAECGARAADVREDVHDAYNERLDEALAKTIWTHPGMTTYYRNSKGRIVTNIPWRNVDYWELTRRADAGDFELLA
jgi:4-hydroxyacetophenone monooxygenase